MDHRHALDPRGFGGLFQVQFRQHRHHEHIVIPVGSLGHQRFEHLRRVLPGEPRHVGPVHRLPLLMGIFVGGVGDFGPLQHSHRVGFRFFCHFQFPLLIFFAKALDFNALKC